MLELGVGADIVRGIGWVFQVAFLAALAFALWRGKTWRRKLIYAALVLVVFISPALPGMYRTYEYKQKYVKAKALFDERCKTAGEKVYKTVDNVEGVMLLNPRPDDRTKNEGNQHWSGAGFPKESGGNEFIMEFLYYHRIPTNPQELEGVLPTQTGTRGYHYLDVDEGGQRFRYSLRKVSEYAAAADPVMAYGLRAPTTALPPRYAVAYEDIPDLEGRAYWIAGGRVKVVDTISSELLGEFVRYGFESGFGGKSGQRQPWAFAQQCPRPKLGFSATGHIRLFVEKVLKPK